MVGDSSGNTESDDRFLLCHLTSLTLILHRLKLPDNGNNHQLDGDLKKFDSLLAGFDPSARQLVAGIPVRELLQEIIEILHQDASILRWDRVYSSLLGRTTSHLVELFGDVHCRHTFNLYQSTECRNVGVFRDDKLTDFQKCIVGLSRNPARSQAWRDMYTVCWTEDRHFLDSILVCWIILQLICSSQVKCLIVDCLLFNCEHFDVYINLLFIVARSEEHVQCMWRA